MMHPRRCFNTDGHDFVTFSAFVFCGNRRLHEDFLAYLKIPFELCFKFQTDGNLLILKYNIAIMSQKHWSGDEIQILNISTRPVHSCVWVWVCVCRCFCGFDVHVLMNCRYKEKGLRDQNYSTNCRQGYFTRREASRGALDVIAFLLFGFALTFSRLRARSNCAPIIFQLVSCCIPITTWLQRNKSAFRETNPNIKAWEHLFSGRVQG